MPTDEDALTDRILEAADDPALAVLRSEVARALENVFRDAGRELHAAGHIFGGDRVAKVSPFGNGSDETVGVSVLLRIATQLLGGTVDLLERGRTYAAAALLRQIVEVEYLSWAFEARDHDARRWLRSSREERDRFFKAGKLRDASNGRFRGKDYWRHCELGGHPVPSATRLLQERDVTTPQLLLVDAILHVSRIWEHLHGWAEAATLGKSILSRDSVASAAIARCRDTDPLAAALGEFLAPA